MAYHGCRWIGTDHGGFVMAALGVSLERGCPCSNPSLLRYCCSGEVVVVIGVLAAWPATVLLVVAAALSLRAPDREETYELGNVAALSRILDL